MGSSSVNLSDHFGFDPQSLNTAVIPPHSKINVSLCFCNKYQMNDAARRTVMTRGLLLLFVAYSYLISVATFSIILYRNIVSLGQMPAGSVNLVSPVSPRLISDLQPGHVGFLTSLSLNSHSRRNPRPPPSFRCCKSRGVIRAVHPGCCSRAPRGLPLLRRGSRTVSDSRSRSAPRVKALRGEEASPGRGV